MCLCGCFSEQYLTTETQRTQRLHREECKLGHYQKSGHHHYLDQSSTPKSNWITTAPLPNTTTRAPQPKGRPKTGMAMATTPAKTENTFLMCRAITVVGRSNSVRHTGHLS